MPDLTMNNFTTHLGMPWDMMAFDLYTLKSTQTLQVWIIKWSIILYIYYNVIK